MKTKAKLEIKNFFIPNIVYVLIFGLTLRILLAFFGTLDLDQGTFIAWSNNLVSGGFKTFYDSWSDYLPGYLYVLWLLGKINLAGIIPEVILYKIPAVLADLITGFLIYKILKKSKGEGLGLIGCLIYIFNPAILANSTLWGQVDSLTALSTVVAIYLLDTNFLLSAAILSLGTLVKPQAAFALPVILFLFAKNKRKTIDVLLYCFVGLTIFILAFVPFSNGNIFEFVVNRLNISASQYPYTSVNAFNFWGLFGFWNSDNVFFQFGGYLLVSTVVVFLFIKFTKKKLTSYHLLSFIFATSFIFFTRMHERHLLPLFAPLAIIAIRNPIFLIPYLGFSFTYLANMSYSYQWISHDFREIFPEIINKFFIVVNLSLVAFMFYAFIKNIKGTWERFALLVRRFIGGVKDPVTSVVTLPKMKLSKRKSRMILFVILAFALAARIFKLGNPSTMYFDEVYHAFTAQVMMGADATKAWEWWNDPPEGFAYEWTHPPLAKLGMVLGMSIFGQNQFGWRIPGALLGVGSVFLIYLIARKIFKDEAIGLISAAVFSLDGLSLVLSRIGMNDSYILFFLLLAVYMFIKQKDFFAALAYGLALASKWSALWVVPILFILWLKRSNKLKPSVLWFLLIPPVVYFLSYLPMFTTGHDFSTWWGMQKQMWWYHTGLDATHPYTSPWWSWPFLIRPVYLYTSDEVAGFVSRIYLIGNPFIFWFGIVSVAMCAIFSYLERNRKLGFIVFCYLILFIPWAASPRIMFLYHYLPSVPFMCMAIGYVLRRHPKIIFTYLLIGLLAFLYFYPHWIGLNIPQWLDRSYYWVSSWR